jgi:hypothetical protein
LPTTSDKKISTKENQDYIDFFASIEQEHTVIFSNQLHQNTGTNTLGSFSTNPFLTMQNQGNQSPIQQNLNQSKLQRISTIKDTNPFRSSVYVQDSAPISPISQAVVPYQNPFYQPLSSSTNSSNPFYSLSSTNSGAQIQQTIQPSITPSVTSTIDSNPFRRLSMSPGLASQQTNFHSQDSSTSSFQSTSSTFSQTYSGF